MRRRRLDGETLQAFSPSKFKREKTSRDSRAGDYLAGQGILKLSECSYAKPVYGALFYRGFLMSLRIDWDGYGLPAFCPHAVRVLWDIAKVEKYILLFVIILHTTTPLHFQEMISVAFSGASLFIG